LRYRLRRLLGPVPGHELVPWRRWSISCDLPSDIGDVGLRVDAVGLAGLDDGVDRRAALAARFRTGEQSVASSDGNAAQRAFGNVVIDLQAPVIDMATQCRPSLRAIGDGLGHVGLWRQLAQSRVQCLAQRIDQRPRPVLPRRQPHIGRPAAELGFYAVQGTDAFKNVGGQRRGNPLVQVEYLAPEMGPARGLGDAASIERVVTGIGVGLEEASKSGEMGLRMRTGAVGREAIPRRRRGRVAGGVVVDRIDP
jgi:hypothetical protein